MTPEPVALEHTFDGFYGLEYASAPDDDGALRGRLHVRPQLIGGGGVLHGGVPAAIAEGLASYGTMLAVLADGRAVAGLSNDTSIVAPAGEGATLDAVARPVDRADDYWLWSVELRDQSGGLCAFSRVTIAVRPSRSR